MATYTTRNRLTKQAQNENFNSWGTVLNAGGLDMIDEAMDGVTALAISGGNVTLTDEDGATDQARKRVLNITSADQARTITIPAVEKVYLVRNASAYVITLTVSGGSSVEVLGGQSAWVFTNGTNIYRGTVIGWGLYETVTPSSSPSTLTSTFNNLNQHYTDCMILLEQLTVPSGTNLTFLLRNDAGSGGTATLLDQSSGAINATLHLPDYRNSRGVGYWSAHRNLLSSSPQQTTTPLGVNGVVWNITGGIGSILWTSGGPINNSGNIKVYLR